MNALFEFVVDSESFHVKFGISQILDRFKTSLIISVFKRQHSGSKIKETSLIWNLYFVYYRSQYSEIYKQVIRISFEKISNQGSNHFKRKIDDRYTWNEF